MRLLPFVLPLAAPVAAIALSASAALARGQLTASATSTTTGQITVHFEWSERSDTGLPDWIGCDVYRQTVLPCGTAERVNAEVIPRTVGASHVRDFVDIAPSIGVMYQYAVWMVDASRAQVYPDCEPPCVPPAWACTPNLSAPVTVATIHDFGWAPWAIPCPAYCAGSFLIEDAQTIAEMRAQGLVNDVARLYGPAGCCSVEGPSMSVASWKRSTCGALPALRSSWGRVKTTYR